MSRRGLHERRTSLECTLLAAGRGTKHHGLPLRFLTPNPRGKAVSLPEKPAAVFNPLWLRVEKSTLVLGWFQGFEGG